MSDGKKILVVDDEPDVCTYLSRLFEDHGYAVRCAADGEQALEAVRLDKPDLITLDLSMPHTSGVRFYREIKAHSDFSSIPVIFVTGVTGPTGSPADTERFYASRRQIPPPDAFVAKPIDPEEMLGLVRRLLGQGGSQ
jgi:CheY-like chemotaxis protein